MKKPQSHSWPLLIALVICIFPLLLCGAAGRQTTKPKLKVAADGLPSGHDTPEGAACDLARSFINRDEKLFSTTPIRLYADAMDRTHMRNSFKRLSKVSRQKPPRRSRHRKGREALERFSRRGTSVNPALFRTVTQLSALRTSCSLTLASTFTTGSAQ